MHLLETLALVHAPIQVTAFQEVPLVEWHGFLQSSRAWRVQVLASYPLAKGKGLLEDRHVQPKISLGVDVDPVGLDAQQASTDGFGPGVYGGLELPQSLPQVLSRLIGRTVAPKHARQGFSGLWMAAVKQKIAKELLHLMGIQARNYLIV